MDADIETQLAIAPDVSHLIVYNAPNDFTGQTELDEWSAIAKANVADSVSSSWALCENDITSGYAHPTGAGHIAKNNGLYPAVPGYDLATGIGAIKMARFITGFL